MAGDQNFIRKKKVSHTGVQVLLLEVFAACSVVQESFVLGERKA
jgi:hypothetical protein